MDQATETNYIVDGLKENYRTFQNNVWRLCGLGALAIGWLMTSETAGRFLSGHPECKIMLIAVLIMAGIAHSYVNFKLYKRSDSLSGTLGGRGISMQVYEANQITRRIYYVNTIVVLFVLAVGVALTLAVEYRTSAT